MRLITVLGLDTDDSQELTSLLPARNKGISINIYQALLGVVLELGDAIELGERVIIDDLVDDLDRDHNVDIALFDFVRIDKLAAAISGQLVVFDVEGTIYLRHGQF